MPEGRCPLCSERAHYAFTTWDRNRGVSGESFRYDRCERCASLHLVNVPGDLGRYYPPEYHSLGTREDLNRVAAAETYKLDLITAHVNRGRLVEIGAGAGGFAHLAARAGFDYTGLDMDAGACAHLTDVVGVAAICTDDPVSALPRLPSSDAIAMWHVIEHLRDPLECLAAAAANLVPGGVLTLATPNPESLQLRVLGFRWPHVDAPRHLFLISASLIVERAAAAGLEPVAHTTDDPVGRSWDKFGWRRALAPAGSGLAARVMGRAAGETLLLAATSVERRGLRGATYTLVLRKSS